MSGGADNGMSTNLYGPNDNFDLKNSHVLPALMRRFHKAKGLFPLWEFLHINNLADAVVFLMEEYTDLGHMNVGSGKEVSIKELAKEVVGFEGDLIWDKSKHDGTPRN